MQVQILRYLNRNWWHLILILEYRKYLFLVEQLLNCQELILSYYLLK
nr:MAG TPA: hypothetical protein [Bacteriophage sp.]